MLSSFSPCTLQISFIQIFLIDYPNNIWRREQGALSHPEYCPRLPGILTDNRNMKAWKSCCTEALNIWCWKECLSKPLTEDWGPLKCFFIWTDCEKPKEWNCFHLIRNQRTELSNSSGQALYRNFSTDMPQKYSAWLFIGLFDFMFRNTVFVRKS